MLEGGAWFRRTQGEAGAGGKGADRDGAVHVLEEGLGDLRRHLPLREVALDELDLGVLQPMPVWTGPTGLLRTAAKSVGVCKGDVHGNMEQMEEGRLLRRPRRSRPGRTG